MCARNLFLIVIAMGVVLLDSGCRRRGQQQADYDRMLRPGEQALVEVPPAELPSFRLVQSDRAGLLRGIDCSLKWLATPTAAKTYPIAGISLAEVRRGLEDFRQLLQSGASEAEVDQAIRSRFRVMRSVGWNGQGSVLFTGYYTPLFEASRVRTATHRYPLYRRPTDFVPAGLHESHQKLPDGSTRPYPGRNELLRSGALDGLELAWFADPFDPYIIQVQGSAKLRLTDGSTMEIGMHGTTGHEYVAIALKMVEDGVMPKEQVNLKNMRDHFRAHPEQVAHYTGLNPRFVFFTERPGGPFGSLNQPVTADVTIATDKKIFPPAALTFVDTTLGYGRAATRYSGFRLDQDTGGAIQAPGRCDLYMGEGAAAEQRAGMQREEGTLYYLLAR